jgi:hypothetical protein
MTFVPIVPTPVQEDVSPRARDLARNLEQSLAEYRSRNPTLSDAEIRQALSLMSQSRSSGARALLLGLLVAGLAIGVIVTFMVSGGEAAAGGGVRWVAIAIGGIAAVLGILAAARRGGGG